MKTIVKRDLEVWAVQWYPHIQIPEVIPFPALNWGICTTELGEEFVLPGDWIVILPNGVRRLVKAKDFSQEFDPF